MGKIDKETRLRVDGMRRALEIAEEKGVDALRAEVKMRGSLGIPCAITREKAVESFHLLARRMYATYVWWFDLDGQDAEFSDPIIAWMPLPEPYGGENE